MKILQINLSAFGPFTDQSLDLSGGSEGLHVIYGPNEAGKSASLRALMQMLYGIPERSSDDFVHPYAKMRIGALLRHSDGAELAFIRRKGRANTLRGADDKTPLDEALLKKFLGGLDSDLFSTMFGIDHEGLIRGGREIVKGGGSLGQILFAAGSGISDLRHVQLELRSEAETLFAPNASKRRINEAIATFKKNRRELRDAQLPGQRWVQHDQALRDALEQKRDLERDLEKNERKRHRLGRVREALPLIARRQELLADLQDYSHALLLPEDFGERRRELLTALKVAENTSAQFLQSTEGVEKAIAELQIPEGLLENADLIEELHQELGSYQKATGDRAKLMTRRDILWGEAREILSGLREDLTLDEAESLRLKRAETIGIQELGTRYERLVTKREDIGDEIPRLSLHIEGLDGQIAGMETPRPINDLRSALDKALKYGAMEDHCRAEKVEISNTLVLLEAALSKQTLWSGTLEKLERLPMPSLEAIDRFEEHLNESEGRVGQLRGEIRTLEDVLVETEGQIEELRLEQEVPTEGDLLEARGKRQQGWKIIRQIWEGGEEPEREIEDFLGSFQPAENLAEAFEISVTRADEVSDRLRREADRVAKKAKLLADRETRRRQARRLRQRLGEAEKELKETETQWVKQWEPTGIIPGSPREMRAWVLDLKTTAENFSKIRERREKGDDLTSRIEAHRKALDQGLRAISEPRAGETETLSDLIKRARRVVERQESTKSKREQLLTEKRQRERELTEARIRSEKIEDELSQWKSLWGRAIRPLGLDADAIPAQAGAVMEDLKKLFETLKEAGILHSRIKGIDRDEETFSRKVSGLVEQVVQDLREVPVEQAAAELNARLNRARTARSQRQSLEKQRRKEEDRLEKAKNKIAELGAHLDGLCQEAGCLSYEELPGVEKRSEKRRRLESDLENLEGQLRRLSAGATIEAFVREAREIDPDGIDGEIARLGEEIDRLTGEKSALDQTIGSERTELSKMDGGARAAELAEENQMILGGLGTDVEHYVRLRLASAVLNRAIERYREKHQGPVLKRANALFAQMTLGSFEGVRAEFDEQGRPVLVGVRPGGKDVVAVEGMSDGTADQLYLALRLASLDRYLETNEPIPFIVDDIMVQFDDERAAATLQVIAELAQRTQVIFFTHHRHLLELAEAHVDSSILFIHTL